VAVVGVLAAGTLYGYTQKIDEQHLCDPVVGTAWSVVSVSESVDSTRYTVAAETGCRMLVTVSLFPRYAIGDALGISGGARSDLVAVADFNSGYADYLARKNIQGTWYLPRVTLVTGSTTNVLSLDTWRLNIVDRVRRVFIEPDGSMIAAMLLADKGRIPESVVRDFRRTGVSHILAISGLHISIIAGILVVLFSLFSLPPPIRFLVISSCLWLFISLIGFPVSAVRAGLFWTLALLGLRLQLLISLPTVLVLTVLILTFVHPLLWQDVGWQLSLSAVIGIFVAQLISKSWSKKLRGIPKALYSFMVVSAGATIATAPLVAYHFGIIAPVSLIANLLTVPLVPAILVLSIIALVGSSILPAVGILLVLPVHGLLVWIRWITHSLAAIPFAFREEVFVSVGFVWGYYAIITVLVLVLRGTRAATWREIWAP